MHSEVVVAVVVGFSRTGCGHNHRQGATSSTGIMILMRHDDVEVSVLRGAAHGPRALVEPLGEPKVGQLEVAAAVEQHVLGLDVAVHDVQVVEVLEREHKLERRVPEGTDAEYDKRVTW